MMLEWRPGSRLGVGRSRSRTVSCCVLREPSRALPHAGDGERGEPGGLVGCHSVAFERLRDHKLPAVKPVRGGVSWKLEPGSNR